MFTLYSIQTMLYCVAAGIRATLRWLMDTNAIRFNITQRRWAGLPCLPGCC